MFTTVNVAPFLMNSRNERDCILFDSDADSIIVTLFTAANIAKLSAIVYATENIII
jgi:hypothetical protein